MKTSSKITKVGIIGAGQMGSGIAHVCAQFGFDVLLYDIAKEVIDNSLIGIEKQAKRLHEKQRITKKSKCQVSMPPNSKILFLYEIKVRQTPSQEIEIPRFLFDTLKEDLMNKLIPLALFLILLIFPLLNIIPLNILIIMSKCIVT